MTADVMAVAAWRTNGELIADCARLGYLRPDWSTFDATLGGGGFWTSWQPNVVQSSCDDFRALPFADETFDVVVFDPPYKLNGTPTLSMDARYGVDEATPWRDRMQLIADGVVECARVSRLMLLVKCQDQVCSGKVRWQTLEVTHEAAFHGFGLLDRFDMLSHRPQPPGRRQVHARRNVSTLLVFKREHNWR